MERQIERKRRKVVKKTKPQSKQSVKKDNLEKQIKAFYEDKEVRKIIKPKYNFLLKFYDELNINITIVFIFMILIIFTGDNKVLSGLVVLFMFLTLLLKAIVDYKIFEHTIYLLYKDKIVRKNMYFNKDKVLKYDNLKDIRYGSISNSFIKTIMNIKDIQFIHKNSFLFKFKDIKIPNQPDDAEYRDEIIKTVDPKYLKRILLENKK